MSVHRERRGPRTELYSKRGRRSSRKNEKGTAREKQVLSKSAEVNMSRGESDLTMPNATETLSKVKT